MPTKHDYELASARYMCMREEGLLSQLSEAQYLDNLKMIGITWHGPRDPAAELATVRDCEHPACEALRNQPSSVVVTPLMPDGSLETVLDGRVVYRETDLVKHWDFRRQQRVNRKRRAARKSKRGWS
jgi:hypothetical protein